MDRKSKKVSVPAGRYIIYYAEISSRHIRDKVYAVGDKMRKITVGDKPVYELKWGLPLKLEFRVDRIGSEYTVRSVNTRVCGSAGAEYRIKGRQGFFRQPVRVEFYYNNRVEAKRVITSATITVRGNRKKRYKIRMIGKSEIFGTIIGEKER